MFGMFPLGTPVPLSLLPPPCPPPAQEERVQHGGWVVGALLCVFSTSDPSNPLALVLGVVGLTLAVGCPRAPVGFFFALGDAV